MNPENKHASDQNIRIESFTPALSVGNERINEAFNPDRARKLLASFALISREIDLYPPKGAIDRAERMYDKFETSTAADRRVMVMSNESGEVLGAAEVRYTVDAGKADIDAIAIDTKRQGEGLGGQLLEEIEHSIEKEGGHTIELEAAIDTNTARLNEWYQKRGYDLLSSDKSSYSPHPKFYKHINKKSQ